MRATRSIQTLLVFLIAALACAQETVEPPVGAVPGSASLQIPPAPQLPATGLPIPQVQPTPLPPGQYPPLQLPHSQFPPNAYPPAVGQPVPHQGALPQLPVPMVQYGPQFYRPVPQVYYWRVGTRGCGQTFSDGICNCRLSVSSCVADGSWKPSSEAELLANLVPQAPICVMTHGSLVDEWGSRLDSRGTYRWLRNAAPGLPLNVIFFDWPSQRCVGPHAQIQFIKLGRQAARNGFPLAQFVSRLPVDSPICLMGHSHGARTVAAATHLLSGGTVQGKGLGHVDRVHRLRLVLAAAAIDHHWLNPGERYDKVVPRAESIVSIENSKDFALALYPLQRPFGAKPLGSHGFFPSDEKAIGPHCQRIYHIRVTDLLGPRHVWPYYYKQPQIARAIVTSVYFSDQIAVPRPVMQAPQIGHQSFPTFR